MLSEDQKKLRWWGIDMRSRTARRVAVVSTYVVFLVAEWWPPRRTYEFLVVVFYAGLLMPVWPVLEAETSAWVRRVLAGVTLLGAACVVWGPPVHQAYALPTAPVAFLALWLSTIFAPGKLVEMSRRGWLLQAVNTGEPVSARRQRRLARVGFAIGLEGFAWHEYRMPFRRLSAEQQADIREMRAANPRGKWMRERLSVLFDDERMRQEDDRLRASVQAWVSVALVMSAMGLWWSYESGRLVPRELMVAWAMTLAGLSVTLRQAIVLWTEEDPRAGGGELVVVGREVLTNQ